jgi:hypothetical protein
MLFVSTNWSGFFRVSREIWVIHFIARVICSGFPIGKGWRRVWATYGGSASTWDLLFSAGLVFVSTRSLDLSYSKLFSRLVVPRQRSNFFCMNELWSRSTSLKSERLWNATPRVAVGETERGGDDGSADLLEMDDASTSLRLPWLARRYVCVLQRVPSLICSMLFFLHIQLRPAHPSPHKPRRFTPPPNPTSSSCTFVICKGARFLGFGAHSIIHS